jgi:hypothetical protein
MMRDACLEIYDLRVWETAEAAASASAPPEGKMLLAWAAGQAPIAEFGSLSQVGSGVLGYFEQQPLRTSTP